MNARNVNRLRNLGISAQLLLPIALCGVVLLACIGAVGALLRAAAVEQAGVATGRALAGQVTALRGFYTVEIAARAREAGMELGFDFAHREKTLPLPATLVKSLGESIAREHPGMDVRLLSRYPFPNRGRPLDEFESTALAALEKDPAKAVHRVERVNDRLSVRYAVADVMQAGCVSCHNSHPLSPRKDWSAGDVRGMVEVIVPVDSTAATMTTGALSLGAVIACVFAAMGALIWYLARRIVGRPLVGAGALLARIASGDLSMQPDVRRADEIGSLYGSMRAMVVRLRETVGAVKAATDAINTAAREIAQGNADLSQRTEEQASSLEQTASSMEELTSTVKQNAENARQANQLAAGASEVALRGGDVVRQVVSTMNGISQSSKKIADIIGVIDGIAFQTNILALNAAVEAARAGEQGRGFAVVASEVRNLAQRSAAAAKEIKALIEDSVGKVEAGTQYVDAAGRTMGEIVASVKRVTDIMVEITAASQAQSSGIEQVNAAITQMDEVTQQNAALVEEAAAAAESMEEQARSLAQLVAQFRLEHGAAAPAPAPVVVTEAKPVVKNVAKLERRFKSRVAGSAPANEAPRAKKVAGADDDWKEF